MIIHNRKIAVLGLGYVGLPVAMNFGLKGKTFAFDVNKQRISELSDGIDITQEVSAEELKRSDLFFTSEISELSNADFYIVAVPTPIDEAKTPNLGPMISASELVGNVLKKGDIVVYESTVYPGACEEVCLPVLEKKSGLKRGVDFKIGYSPERINPGDKEHSFTKITKIVSAEDDETLDIVANVYASVVDAGIYKAESIKIAEAAKVIENTQRDINIALVNELAIIFDKMGIDTNQVLKAAGTKWNFLKFFPGLVGGHCIGVDPYYLTYKSELLGHFPEMILAGRKINDSMSNFIVEKTIKLMIDADMKIKGAKLCVLGLTFKENCPDVRNSKVTDIISALLEYGINVKVYDPYVNLDDLALNIRSIFVPLDQIQSFDVIILAVGHNLFCAYGPLDYLKHLRKEGVFVDVKGLYSKSEFKEINCNYWRL